MVPGALYFLGHSKLSRYGARALSKIAYEVPTTKVGDAEIKSLGAFRDRQADFCGTNRKFGSSRDFTCSR